MTRCFDNFFGFITFQNLNINDLKVKAFQKAETTEPSSTLYLPCNRHGLVPSVAENDTSRIHLQEMYLLLGRNFKHWKACLESLQQNTDANAAELAPKEMRPLQRFQPLVTVLHSSSEPNSRADTPKLASPTATDSQELKNPGSLFIPRQRLLLSFVHRNWIQLYAYNCSRDVNEKLNKQISNLGHWFAARSALSMSLVAQKCGLFHHQPFLRQSKKSKKANPYLNETYLEPLVKHFSPQNPVERAAYEGQIGKTYLDRKPSTTLQKQPYSIGNFYLTNFSTKHFKIAVSQFFTKPLLSNFEQFLKRREKLFLYWSFKYSVLLCFKVHYYLDKVRHLDVIVTLTVIMFAKSCENKVQQPILR